jgi:cbb3-type cytochrome oxidase maturation protein
MLEATIAQTLFTAALAGIFGGFLWWGIRTGQFRDTEASKYRIADQPAPTDDEGDVDQ